MEQLVSSIQHILPVTGMAAGVMIVFFFMKWMLLDRHPELSHDRRLTRKLALAGIVMAGMVLIAFALPIRDSTRNHMIALLGILSSAAIAFSSTTIIANFMAGIMLRINKPFQTGDFIRVGDHFGRVSERGLFDTEIQSEHRELISLPNKYLISQPVVVASSTGAIVSATLSLGYDLYHSKIEPLLILAAEKAGLDEPFVQVTELGNDAITYRISGLLTDVKSLLSTRSVLHRYILDTLHSNDIEIVSPRFINQRRLDDCLKVISRPTMMPSASPASKPEDIIFDKAEQAEQHELAIQTLEQEIHSLEAQLKQADHEEKKQTQAMIEAKLKQIHALENNKENDPSS
jgi:small conductance mechanosensitive channel